MAGYRTKKKYPCTWSGASVALALFISLTQEPVTPMVFEVRVKAKPRSPNSQPDLITIQQSAEPQSTIENPL